MVNTTTEEETLHDLKSTLNYLLQETIGTSFLNDASPAHRELANGLEFRNIYYAGGTLCIDTNKDMLLMLNICDETITLQKISVSSDYTRHLMPIKLIWFAFFIYRHTKAENKYYMECFNKSCLRHLYNPDLEAIENNSKSEGDVFFQEQLKELLNSNLN